MATTQISGAGGTTVSFSNTPQAQGDVFYFSEDSTGVLILNVLSNDLGGAAKQLYSIDNADSATTSTKTYAPADLLIRDTAYSTDTAVPVATADTSYLGARIWISTDGTIHYDKTSIDSKIQALGAGQVLTDKLTYAIQLGNGTLSWATATIQFTGTNDAPVISAHTDGAVTEDNGVQGSGGEAGTEHASGSISFADVDLTDTHTVSAVAQASGYVGTFSPTIATDSTGGVTGTVGWSFSVDDSAIDHLGAGESLVQKYDVTISDGHGGTVTQTVTVTVHGTNDAPVITSAAQSGTVSEGDGLPPSSMSATGQVTFTDVDTTDSHTFSVSVAAAHGTASVDPNGTWHYTVSDSGAVDALAAGEHLSDSFTVQVDDGHGGLAAQVVTITINGANDAAVISGTSSGTVVEAGGVA
ncbi:VCBS domain-containing protein, partial [Mesorhizobium sp. B1-1-5]|uniref:VCBS domain-containing protein n=1 Tax=Mesorhizobium sp. B1-1-5 TaxID=2589979 RepID=UPI0011672B27